MREPQIKVGHIIKSFGKDGQVRVAIEDHYKEDILRNDYLIIQQDGYNIPYFIEKISSEFDLVKFESIDGPEAAFSISNKAAFLLQRHVSRKSVVHHVKDKDQELIGYTLLDQHNTDIGIITEILELPMQILFKVDYHGQEKLIPFHEDLFLSIDNQEQNLQIEVSEGLIDL